MKPKINDKVVVTDGSSDGHTGTIIAIKGKTVRIRRDADNQEVDVANFVIISKKNETA